MRTLNFKKISFSFLIFALALCSILGFSINNAKVNAAEELPSYFSVRQYTKYDETNSDNNIFVNIGNGEVAYVSASNIVETKLYYETDGTNPIKSITPFVKFNGQTINTNILEKYSLTLEYNTVMFKLKSIFNDTTKTTPYGKYEIVLDYIFEDAEGIQSSKSISYSYYIVRDSDYYNGKNANVQISNAVAIEKDNLSQLYDRIYQYNYNHTEGNDTNALPTVSFNKKHINIKIVKTFQKTTQTQRIWYDGTTLHTDNNLVYITENIDNDFITLTFNDLGTYALSYNFTYFNNNVVEDILPAVSIFTNIKRSDLIEIFGYQIYYSDSQTAELKEFKSINQNGVIGREVTDITYLYNTFNKSIDSSQKYSQSKVINGVSTDSNGYSGILEKLNNKELIIQQTNQAPVQFKYNVEIFSEANAYETQSKYWLINEIQAKDGSDNLLYNPDGSPIYEYSLANAAGTAYDNRPLSEAGIYLLNIVYKFYPTIVGSDELCEVSSISADSTEKLRSQWFLFRITKETAKMSVESDGHILADESYTNKDVVISKIEGQTSIFNATTQLDLYIQRNYRGAYEKIATIENNTQFTATESGNYEVKMLFGKNLTRSYSTNFTIDKDPIENIQIFSVNQYSNSNLYYRNTQIDFMTNQSVIVSWNNKASNSEITAKYKFIPLVYSNAAFDASLLEQFYKNYSSVPSEYYFDFNNEATLTEVDYRNTQNISNIPSGNVLSQAGLYVFKVSDTAGNEKYFAFIIDNSPARILQRVKGQFVQPTSLNILSSDVTVVWGDYKVTKFNNLTYSSGQFVFNDTWLNYIFNQTDIYENYFQMMNINTINQFFFKTEIESNVLVSTDGIYSWIIDRDHCDLKFLNSDNEALEHDYSFFVRDSLNTRMLPGEQENSVNNYVENYSATHRIKISSDSSLSELVYTSKGKQSSLYQDDFNSSSSEIVSGTSYSKKDKFFIPTTINTLKESGEILKFIFNPTPEPGVIEIDTIEYKFSPFTESVRIDNRNNLAYTYSFFDYTNSESITIYSRTQPTLNSTYINGDGMYVWDINKEYNNITSSYQTKAGKYTITRTYANLSNTTSKVNESHDYMIRTLTFIVDRNGIVSSPVLTESSTTKLYSYVGEAIKLQVLEEDENKMFFDDIYLASNNISNNTPILETNKLPVFVLIPNYKYGYSFVDGGAFTIEDSIVYYNTANKNASKIDSFSLSAEVKYSKELSTIDQATTIFTSYSDENDSYLKFEGISSISGRAFKEVGYYKITIKQGFASYGKNEFSFIFRIKTGEPSFSVNNTTSNEELPTYNNNYYTNQEVVRLYWEDPASEFEAKINTSQIYYSVNGGSYKLINEALINRLDKVNTIDLNLKDIGAYSHGSTINISMQFEGKEIDYSAGSFKKIKTIVVDTIAPRRNINQLVSLSGIDPTLVRNVQTKYNTSVSSGIYKFYSFAVDVSQLETILDFTSHQDGEAFSMYYRAFVNPSNNEVTKYNNIYQQETLPSEIENSTTNFTEISANLLLNDLKHNSNLYNNYIEIVEIDLAGNITIYTIYLTNITPMAGQVALEYANNNENKFIYYSDLASNFNIYAKSSFALKNVKVTKFAWNKITIGSTTYLKTPYSDGSYYNLSIYDETNPTNSETELSEFGKLAPSSQIQTINIELVPMYNKISFAVSVLNTSLSVIHTSTTSLYSNEEGILIKLPSTTTVQDAKIYAKIVEVNQYVKDAQDNDVKQNLYYVNSDTYFASIQDILSSPTAVTLTYVNYMGSTYIKIRITAPVANRFYTYSVTDNFNDNYPITSIYGSEIIEKELYSYVDIVQTYENGKLYNYSTKNTFFKYNSAKDRITLTVATTNYTNVYDFSKQEDVEKFNSSGFGKLTMPVKNSVVYTVEMYAPTLDMSEGIIGAEISFTINKFTAIEAISTGFAYDTINLIIYNIVPNIYLYGVQNQLENALFNKGTMYGNEIKISFRQNSGRIPCTIYLQYEDGSIEQIASDKVVSDPAIYTIIIRYTDIFIGNQYDVYLDFTISDNDEDFYKVIYKQGGENHFAKATGTLFSYTDGIKTYSIETHFIVNTTEFEIIYNTEQGIEAVSVTPITSSGFTTYLYTLSNQNSTTSTSFFNRTIAITVIPHSSNILKNYSYYENEGNPILLEGTLSSFVVSKEETNIGYKRISWQSYYGIPENTVDVTIFFGDNNTIYTARKTTENNITSIELTTSGTYYLQFKDKAGNVHMFNTSTSTYTIRYLRSVIYNVNGESPINNAIYDSEVVINVPSSTSKYYDSNAQPKINVLKNGVKYSPEADKSNRTYTFKEAGLYKVWFSAAVTDAKTGLVTQINEEPLYFLIIKPQESRWAFDFSEYGDYYVKQIIKNGEDVTHLLSNANMGNLTYKTVVENGVSTQKAYLKNFLISVNDAVTGRGSYTVTISTDNEFNQEFTFSFWINNTQPAIKISAPENSETTDVITVSFNTIDLLEDIGDCVLRITNGIKLTVIDLNQQLLADGEITPSYNLKIENSGTYYIQLFSESGKLLYSYRVIKNDPLNAISIIVIVVVTIVVVGLTVVFIMLRKKMKIR